MGTWGYRIFEDDASCDWYDEFCAGNQSFETLEEAIEDVIDIEDFLEHEICSGALVTAEIICAASGHKSKDFPDKEYHEGEDDDDDLPSIDLESIKSDLSEDFITRAQKAVKKVKKYSRSELLQIWSESDDYDKWLKEIDNLIDRLEKCK
tara:strand:- start:30 stop:479 length:450 start_codon:yes stop_codon:yes gene_type:complete